jgi:hypothetical protein
MPAPVATYPGTDAIITTTGSKSPLRAAVNATAAGANTVVAAVAGSKILVLQYVLVASNGVTVTWESQDGTVIGGPMTFAAQGGAAPPFNPVGQLETKLSQSLVLYLSGAVQVGGHVQYVLV